MGYLTVDVTLYSFCISIVDVCTSRLNCVSFIYGIRVHRGEAVMLRDGDSRDNSVPLQPFIDWDLPQRYIIRVLGLCPPVRGNEPSDRGLNSSGG